MMVCVHGLHGCTGLHGSARTARAVRTDCTGCTGCTGWTGLHGLHGIAQYLCVYATRASHVNSQHCRQNLCGSICTGVTSRVTISPR